MSYKYRPTGLKWPAGITERPLVKELQGHTACFIDGSVAEVDVVLLCTGYRLELPFLSEDLRLYTKRLYYPEGLYKGVLWMNGGNNKFMYVGMHYNIYGLNLIEAQAVWACRNIMGTLELPSKDDMCVENAHWEEKASDANKNNNFEDVFVFMTKYFQYIVKCAGYNEDVLGAMQIFDNLLIYKAENICTMRDNQFKCIYTGKLAPAPKIPYMENFDDTLTAYVEQF